MGDGPYELWRFPGYAVRLIALHSRNRWIVGSPWIVNTMLVDGSRQGCELPRRRRFLTPAEMIQRVRERLEF